MAYQTLTIKNFRGIEYLEIQDMKRVNLLVGRNNCGKTSVLEAIFLLSGMSNPKLPVNIHGFRNLLLTNDEHFNYMFINLNFAVPIHLSATLDNRKRELTMTPIYHQEPSPRVQKHQRKAISQHEENVSASTAIVPFVEGLRLEFKTHHQKVFQGQIRLKEGTITMAQQYQEDVRCSFVNPQTIMTQMDERMERLLVQKKLASVITVLQRIEPRIADIRMGAMGMIYVDIGIEHLVPLNIMGDGLRRMLAILAAIAAVKNGVILVDELENGFHYMSLEILWSAILAACNEYNVQLIATTHSYECIEAFSKAHAQFEPQGDHIRLYRIAKDEHEHTAFAYPPEVLKAGIEKAFEV